MKNKCVECLFEILHEPKCWERESGPFMGQLEEDVPPTDDIRRLLLLFTTSKIRSKHFRFNILRTVHFGSFVCGKLTDLSSSCESPVCKLPRKNFITEEDKIFKFIVKLSTTSNRLDASRGSTPVARNKTRQGVSPVSPFIQKSPLLLFQQINRKTA